MKIGDLVRNRKTFFPWCPAATCGFIMSFETWDEAYETETNMAEILWNTGDIAFVSIDELEVINERQ